MNEVDVLDWWHKYHKDLLACAEACKNVLLIQRLSAAAETTFSININEKFYENFR